MNMDIHEDFFRLSLANEPMLEQMLATYQELGPTQPIDRNRTAIYYQAFSFRLMVGKTGERVDHICRILRKYIEYYDANYSGLGTLSAAVK